MSPHQLIQKLIDLQNGYAQVSRAIVTSERLKHAQTKSLKIDVEENYLREPLLEHIGHLPMIASFLHEHIEHTKDVNLGRVLVMLSIHDIGETVLGDVITYSKKEEQTTEENRVVKELLSQEQLAYFEDFEELKSFDAKFAKTVDAIAPFLHEIDKPKLTRKRFKTWNFNSQKIEAKKKPLFQWDSVLSAMFSEFMQAFRAIENNKPTGFIRSVADLA